MHWNTSGLELTLKQLREKPEGPIRIDLPGRKAGKNITPFFTFFGSDAVEALKKYLDKRGNNPGPIFKTSKKAMIKYWMRRLKRLGYVDQKSSYKGNRYGYNLHRLRGIFRSRWRISGVDVEIAEFFLGHGIDKLGYDKSPWLNPDWYEDKYVEAQPWLNIMTEDPTKISRRAVTDLEKRIRELESENTADIQQMHTELANLKAELSLIFEVLRKD